MGDFVAILPDLISMLAIVSAGLWGFFRLRRERTHTPHIELGLDCQLFGPEGSDYVSELVVVVTNRGLVRQDFHSMELKVRVLAQGDPLDTYMDERVAAPHKVLDVEMVKKNRPDDFLFVEPGVRHLITYGAKVPSEIEGKAVRYLFCRAKFFYDQTTPHSIERLFSVSQCLEQPRILYHRD